MSFSTYKKILHGADYNYEQWLDYPEILDQDLEYMEKSGCNTMTIGIFSWAMLESEEGKYNFQWMDELFERLHSRGIKAILATPSGAKPAWMSEKYPEVCRMNQFGHREPHSSRHNHCRTSPVYREKSKQINTLLADRYGKHPALLMWHVSNEYNGGYCYCDHCLSAFRDWLQNRYKTLDALNSAWWTTFWSHRFSAWEQIFPADESVHGLMLDWQRFISDQTLDFFIDESAPLREITPDIPITTNFMLPDVGMDYFKWARYVDIVSWDNYPRWHVHKNDAEVAVHTSFMHDLFRSMKKKPFLMMESTPNATNWQGISVPKRPGMHLLSSLQAVAHGSDSVMYFQWRQSRGGEEKFHGAVVGHQGHDNTRVFKGVQQVGEALTKMDKIKGTIVKAEVALIYDFQNQWALDKAQLSGNKLKDYQNQCIRHYKALRETGISVDILDCHSSLEGYKLVVAPMLYMVRDNFDDKLMRFVEGGGILVSGYLSGMVDDSDLCFMGGAPGPLKKVFGLRVEDTDVITEHYSQTFCFEGHQYKALHFADEIVLEGASVLSSFDEDMLKGFPALTVNPFGLGKAYYIASRNDDLFYSRFFKKMVKEAGLSLPQVELPPGVSAYQRFSDSSEYLFLMNFNFDKVAIKNTGKKRKDIFTNEEISEKIELPGFGIAVLERSLI